ncbi:MAG: glycosyltransferase [Acidobacteria bacterium]|nr:glycosyltransferase [Acidobacteriota bacterium]
MRILWVKVGGLWPPTSGGRIRSLQILSELSRRHEVMLVTTHESDADRDGLARAVPRCNRIISLPHVVAKKGTPAFTRALCRSWLSRDPVDLWRWRVPGLREQVQAIVSADGLDLCVADFLVAAVNMPFGHARATCASILFEHNVEYLIWKRLARIDQNPVRRALLEIEWRKLRARETQACRRADLTIAVSEEDRRQLQKLAPAARITSVPTGVDSAYFQPDGFRESPARVVFTGSMDWHPNDDGVRYFIDAILPRIRAEVPDVSFAVVGRQPGASLRALAERAGVIVTGRVADVRPFIGEASVYVVPIRAGGGTRLKILEALAMEKAVVSTTVGAEGLPLVPGRHFLSADDPQQFAQSVVSLLRSPGERRRLGEEGRHLVERHHSWARVTRAFEARCEEVVRNRG